MGFLKNLKVKKVSFVRRGANRRKFLLLKSEDVINDGDRIAKGGNQMHELVKAKVMEILKKEQDPEKVISLLKADKDIENLQLNDEDFSEVQTSVEFFKALLPEKKEPTKKEEPHVKKEEPHVKKEGSEKGSSLNLEDVVAKLAIVTESLAKSDTERADLIKTVKKQERDNSRQEILKWLQTECPYLPADHVTTAEEILTLQDVSQSAAQTLKGGLQAASAALANSDVFDEAGAGGSGRTNGHIPGSELIKEIKEAQTEVKKSGNKVNQVELIRGIVASKGRNNYLIYREEVLRRAKLANLGPEVANLI